MAYRDTILATTGLIGYWRLGEASGTVAEDETVNNRDGTITGATVGAIGLLSGDANAAYSFDGVNDRVATAAVFSNFSGTLPFSVEFLYRTATLPALDATHISLGAAIYIWASDSTGGIHLTRAATGTSGVTHGTALTINAAHHIVGTYNGVNLTLYLNKVAASAASAVSLSTLNRAVTIGNYNSGSFYTPGIFDEVAVYNVALSQTTINAHYDAARGAVPGIQSRLFGRNLVRLTSPVVRDRFRPRS